MAGSKGALRRKCTTPGWTVLFLCSFSMEILGKCPIANTTRTMAAPDAVQDEGAAATRRREDASKETKRGQGRMGQERRQGGLPVAGLPVVTGGRRGVPTRPRYLRSGRGNRRGSARGTRGRTASVSMSPPLRGRRLRWSVILPSRCGTLTANQSH